MKTVNVVAAIIHTSDEEGVTKILATQRGYGEFKGGWEFPGGKIEPGETPEEALKREIAEELEAEINVGQLLDVIEYDYPQFHLSMQCFWCTMVSSNLALKEHTAAKWLTKDELDTVEWLPADLDLIKIIKQKGQKHDNRRSLTTLCYIEKDGKYLMLHRTKKEKDINKNKWIGVGGHAEGTEGPEDCLLREVKEETGLTLTKYRFRGLITFVCDQIPPEMMCLFTASEFEGTICPCNEGELEWVDKETVLSLPTWEGDAIFLKLLVEGEERFFTLRLVYEGEKLVEHQLRFYPEYDNCN